MKRRSNFFYLLVMLIIIIPRGLWTSEVERSIQVPLFTAPDQFNGQISNHHINGKEPYLICISDNLIETARWKNQVRLLREKRKVITIIKISHYSKYLWGAIIGGAKRYPYALALDETGLISHRLAYKAGTATYIAVGPDGKIMRHLQSPFSGKEFKALLETLQ